MCLATRAPRVICSTAPGALKATQLSAAHTALPCAPLSRTQTAGLDAARAAGVPISERETLFSTPDDLEELEALFGRFPYPDHQVYVRRGHGFFVLADDVAGAARAVDRVLAIAAEAAAAAAAPEGAAAAAAKEGAVASASGGG